MLQVKSFNKWKYDNSSVLFYCVIAQWKIHFKKWNLQCCHVECSCPGSVLFFFTMIIHSINLLTSSEAMDYSFRSLLLYKLPSSLNDSVFFFKPSHNCSQVFELALVLATKQQSQLDAVVKLKTN